MVVWQGAGELIKAEGREPSPGPPSTEPKELVLHSLKSCGECDFSLELVLQWSFGFGHWRPADWSCLHLLPEEGDQALVPGFKGRSVGQWRCTGPVHRRIESCISYLCLETWRHDGGASLPGPHPLIEFREGPATMRWRPRISPLLGFRRGLGNMLPSRGLDPQAEVSSAHNRE